MYRRWRDSNGRDNEYPNIIRWFELNAFVQWIISLANNQFALHHHQPQPIDANFYLFRKQALQAKLEAEKEGIVVPLTLEEYCLKPKPNPNNQEPQVSMRSLTRYQNFLLTTFAFSSTWQTSTTTHTIAVSQIQSRWTTARTVVMPSKSIRNHLPRPPEMRVNKRFFRCR